MGKLDVGRPVDVWLKPQKALNYKKICMVAEAAEPTPAVPLHRDNCENMQSPAGTRASNIRRVNRSTPTKSKSPIGGNQLATGATPPKNVPNSLKIKFWTPPVHHTDRMVPQGPPEHGSPGC